jgi:hypothetical protein
MKWLLRWLNSPLYFPHLWQFLILAVLFNLTMKALELAL